MARKSRTAKASIESEQEQSKAPDEPTSESMETEAPVSEVTADIQQVGEKEAPQNAGDGAGQETFIELVPLAPKEKQKFSQGLISLKYKEFVEGLRDLIRRSANASADDFAGLTDKALQTEDRAFVVRGLLVLLDIQNTERLPGGRGKKDTAKTGVSAQVSKAAERWGRTERSIWQDAKVIDAFCTRDERGEITDIDVPDAPRYVLAIIADIEDPELRNEVIQFVNEKNRSELSLTALKAYVQGVEQERAWNTPHAGETGVGIEHSRTERGGITTPVEPAPPLPEPVTEPTEAYSPEGKAPPQEDVTANMVEVRFFLKESQYSQLQYILQILNRQRPQEERYPEAVDEFAKMWIEEFLENQLSNEEVRRELEAQAA